MVPVPWGGGRDAGHTQHIAARLSPHTHLLALTQSHVQVGKLRLGQVKSLTQSPEDSW